MFHVNKAIYTDMADLVIKLLPLVLFFLPHFLHLLEALYFLLLLTLQVFLLTLTPTPATQKSD